MRRSRLSFVGSDFYLSPSFNHYRSARKIRRQAQNAILRWLDLLAVDLRELHWSTAADFQPEAALAKAQVRLNRRAARIKRWPDGEGAMLEVHPQVMPDDKQRHFSRGPADQAAERALCPRGRDLLEPQSGTSALAGVETVERVSPRPGSMKSFTVPVRTWKTCSSSKCWIYRRTE